MLQVADRVTVSRFHSRETRRSDRADLDKSVRGERYFFTQIARARSWPRSRGGGLFMTCQSAQWATRTRKTHNIPTNLCRILNVKERGYVFYIH